MERIVHELIQGSPEWHQFRAEHDGASEAAAALGLDKKVSRGELMRAKHSGIAREFSEWLENIFDHGHDVEALAQPIAEDILGDELYPATYSFGRLSASTDGLTMDGLTAWEHKQWNDALATAVMRKQLPDEYQPQCQQIMLVTGAEQVLFMVSDGTAENCVHMFVKPSLKWFERIKSGWAMFHQDLDHYQPAEVLPPVTAAPIMELPALTVQVEGRVVSSNLAAFRSAASTFIANIKTDLQSDQDFANAEKTVKFCKDGEERLEVVKAQALAQTATIDELFRTVDQISAELRSKRLELDKLVKSRKDTVRFQIVNGGMDAYAAHVAGLNKRLGKAYLQTVPPLAFGAAIKGLKTITSIRNAVDAALAAAKIEASAMADRIGLNLNMLRETAPEYQRLFPDLNGIIDKAPDDFAAVVKLRIAEHKEAEKARVEADRERIRQEEQRRAQAEVERLAKEAEAAEIRRKNAIWHAEQAELHRQEEAARKEREAAEQKARQARAEADERDRQQRLAREQAAEATARAERQALDTENMLRDLLGRINGQAQYSGIANEIRKYFAHTTSKALI